MSEDKWISVDERLPEDDKDVLVFVPAEKKYSVWPGYLYNGAWIWCDGHRITQQVTHWRPLPAPPST